MKEGIHTLSGTNAVYADAGQSYVLGIALLVLLLFAAAILVEYSRRWRDLRRQIAAEWVTLRELAREKELSGEAWDALERLIRDYAPKSPLRTATIRQQFDECVEQSIAAVSARHPRHVIEKQGQVLHDVRTILGLDYVPIGQRIHSTRELHIGQAIWIARNDGGQGDWYRMAVVSRNEAFFHLAPHDPGQPPMLKAGDTVRCRMWREEDARYGFEGYIDAIEDNPPLWTLPHTTELNRLQSRAHFRIHFDQHANLAILNAPIDGDLSDLAERQPILRLRGHITSLSGGGFAMIVTQPVPKQVLLRVVLELGPEIGPLEVTGSLVASSLLAAGRHLLRAAFVGLSDENREIITRYIFLQQQPIRQAEAASVSHAE